LLRNSIESQSGESTQLYFRSASQDYIDGTNVSQLNPEGLKLQGNALIQTLNKLMIRQFRMANLVGHLPRT
jgi:hypothetical protein